MVEQRLVYMTPEWKDAFNYAATLADQLGLEMAIAGSPGWSETGGPWVPPAQAMKKLVWSETARRGAASAFTARCPNRPRRPDRSRTFARGGQPTARFYADSAVVAYREPDGDVPLAGCSQSHRQRRPRSIWPR